MADVPVFLDAEAASLAPGQGLVVPEATSIEANVSADRAHVAQHRRCNRRSRFGENGVVLAQKIGTLDRTDRGQGANLDAGVIERFDTAECAYSAEVENKIGLK